MERNRSGRGTGAASPENGQASITGPSPIRANTCRRRRSIVTPLLDAPWIESPFASRGEVDHKVETGYGISILRCGTKTSNRHDCRSEEHTSELQSLMRISYAVFCLKKKKNKYST